MMVADVSFKENLEVSTKGLNDNYKESKIEASKI